MIIFIEQKHPKAKDNKPTKPCIFLFFCVIKKIIMSSYEFYKAIVIN